MVARHIVLLLVLLFPGFLSSVDTVIEPKRLEVLFLGHKDKHHDSGKLADILIKEYFLSGINISYSTDPNDLNDSVLANYDALILYANHDSISTSQEKALLKFVDGGKGFVPLHCASHCFRNSASVINLIGGQFDTHGYDSFATVISKPDHPITQNLSSFITTDETYRHKNLASDITVLTERVEGEHREPYTWVKKHGKGRVFYTAYGHDEKTFNNPGFITLVKNGLLWAVSDESKNALKQLKLAQPEFFDAAIPNYEKREPAPKVQKSLTPEQSMSQIQVPTDFALELFASEPDVINPIFMNWDERGRLWVIETVDYPNEIKDDDEGDDRIKILEDTDNDGRADKITVFADKLNIPTSFVFTNGGIIVSAAPSFLFLKDSDGDDKADVRKTLLTGWGKFDTHAQASNLRYGLDNNIWGVVGYSGFAGKPGKDSVKFANGLYRFTPDGKEIEHLSTTSNNTWGLGFSEEFDVFVSTANNTHTAFFGIPKKYLDKGGIKESGVKKLDAHYNMHVATKNLRQVDVHGGFTAAAGHSLYTARNFPKEYWNRIAFVTEPTGRIVHRAVLTQDGAGFKEDGDGWNIFTSADEWAAPVQAEVGPDGAVWLADWYDFIIQHNPTPTKEKAGIDAQNGAGNAYISDFRDHERGRIYRLVSKKNPGTNNFKLDSKNSSELVKALSHNNMFWRMTAQRLLVEKNDKSVLPALRAIIDNRHKDDMGMNVAALHALWTLHGMGAINGEDKLSLKTAYNALTNPAAAVRKAAVTVLPVSEESVQQMVKSRIFDDKDLRVRLAGIIALMDNKPGGTVNQTIMRMRLKKENTSDEWISTALKIAGGAARAAAEAKPAPAKNPETSVSKTIVVKVIKDQMKFDQELITVKAGTTIRLVLENPDFMQHNLVLIKPGTLNSVGAAADRMAQENDGAKLNYVPKVADVITATPLVNPGNSYALTIRIPDKPGDYPYVCTFPGHWRIMNGILRVTK